MISVVIPSYNCGEYLSRSVRSVLRQDFCDLEVVVVDDGSNDNTPEICAGLSASDERVHVFRIENSGLSYARNYGLRKSSGEYIFFLDADDAITPECLGALYDAMINTASDIGCCATKRVRLDKLRDWSGNDVSEKRFNGRWKTDCLSGEEYLERMLYRTGYPNNQPTKLFKRGVLGKSPFRLKIYYEDLEALPRILLRAKRVVTVHAPFYQYSVRSGSITHTMTPKRADVLKVTGNLVQRMSNYNMRLGKASVDRFLSANFNIYGLITARDKSRDKVGDSEKYEEIEAYTAETIRRLVKRPLFNRKSRLEMRLTSLFILLFGLGGFRFLAKLRYR